MCVHFGGLCLCASFSCEGRQGISGSKRSCSSRIFQYAEEKAIGEKETGKERSLCEGAVEPLTFF